MTKPEAITDKIMDLLVDTIFAVDPEGTYVFASAGCERLLGYKPEELLGRNMLEFMHPADRERTLANVGEVMAGTQQTDFENRYIRKDGRIVDIMWSARWSESEGVRVAVARDVTELRRSTRRQEAMYRISEAAQSAHDLTMLLRHVHEFVGRLLAGKRFYVALYDPAENILSFPYYFDGRERRQQKITLNQDTLVARVIRERRALIANTSKSACGVTEPSSGNREADWIGAPLMSRSGLRGAVVMQLGAVDFGYTETDLEMLQFVSVQIASAIERKSQEEKLLHMAHHDPLTNLPNRILFHDRVDVALCRAKRHRQRVALLYLDLCDFKVVNDELGHAAGDQVLLEIACRLESVLRESDTVSRIGGDEFTVLVNDLHGNGDVDAIAGKLRAAVAAPLEVKGRTLELSVDIGAAVYPECGEDGETLLHYADVDMYQSKHSRSGDYGDSPERERA